MNSDWIFNFISSFSALIPFCVGVFAFPRLEFKFRLLFLMVCAGVFTESINWSMPESAHIRWVLNIYTIVETTLIGLVYRALFHSMIWKRNILITLFIFGSFFISNLLLWQGIADLNSISMATECILLIVLSGGLFNQLINDATSTSLFKLPAFWFNMGIFVYFSINFFTFLLSDAIYGKETARFHGFRIWHIHNIVNVFFNLSFAIALWLAGKPTKEKVAPDPNS